MSGSAALEYGFPSTHSTNAVSVAIYALSLLRSPENTLSPTVNLALQGVLYLYAVSIVMGRLYCGMHGFLDVIVGCGLGALIAFIQCRYGEMYEEYLFSATANEVFLIVLIALVLVRIHPEPADDCPCFDDSVAFAGVFMGAQLGTWHYARTGQAWAEALSSTTPHRLASLGWFRTILRLVLGVLAIFVWREVMKPLLLRTLPPVFRGLEKAGLLLPRRFFTHASYVSSPPFS
jgi:hypothetical protein